ncbi:acyltransferase family protein [Dyadobacter bucti]|uniref:acyltransferase family protein n=1 Tax=Dyadobacter bucti TaxID=2572203 RepID=UPI001108E5F7|nr:acyltransferase family protein [Dyadobacter bucti]
MSTPTGSKSVFRLDINALRAVAVVGVILFHYKVPFFDGGFSGVDIFFVISGYLMTKIIISGLAKDTFSLADFYGRRVQRIIPALLFVVSILVAVTFFFYLPTEFTLIAENAVASVLFYSNMLYQKSNYFDASSDTNMFLHTWSLSVEWQFYLILPLVLMFFKRFFGKDKVKYLLLFIGSVAVIFVAATVLTWYKPTYSFYMLPTRSWEMLMGGIAFLAEDFVGRRGSRLLALIGYGVLAICMVGLTSEMKWPGIYTLVPVLATFMIILSNDNSLLFLKSSVIQFIGKISYSLYLWHWPVYVIAGYLGIVLTPLSVLGMISVSLIMAYISFRYIESIRFETSKRVLIATAFSAAVVFVLSTKSMNDVVFEKKTLEISGYSKIHKAEHDKQFNYACFITTINPDIDREKCLKIDENGRNFVLFGDSHSAHLSQSLREDFAKMNIKLVQASASGCLPVLRKDKKNRCTELIDYIYLDYLPKNAHKIDGVIISANWITCNSPKELVRDLHETIAYLEKLKIKVILIGQNETYTIPYASIAARENEYDYDASEQFSNRFLVPLSDTINNTLRRHFQSKYVDIYNISSIPKVSENNIPYMSDQNHFTKYGADLVAKKILSSREFADFLEARDDSVNRFTLTSRSE